MTQNILANICVSKSWIAICIVFTTTFVLQSYGIESINIVENHEVIGKENYYRLPKYIVPKHYKLKLIPNLKTKTFNGAVTITVQVSESTKLISLHSNKLEIANVTVSRTSECIMISSTNFTKDKRELFLINFEQEITQGFYDIFLQFSGRLDKEIVGFYASKLKNGSYTYIKFMLLFTFTKSRSLLKILTSQRTKNLAMECTKTKAKFSERLSPKTRPVHYKLLLNPDLIAGVFVGNVKIDVKVEEKTNSLNLHKNFLDIKNVKVFQRVQELQVARVTELPKLEQLAIELKGSFSSGLYKIEIDFVGNLTNGFVGFYLSHLKDNRTMVASKFQPTYARQAFPCFDEPDFKATYDISLVKPQSYVALSNMNEISKSLDPISKLETVNFATSVPMSTYLACFVICDFDFKEVEINANGIGQNFKLRAFAQRDETHKIDFAQDIGKRATEFYIKYYEVPFPLPKLDMIAIPDYVSGATEHWGLITYRETQFLIDKATASAKNKLAVAHTVAHELAHMWFGNLVTMKWWDEVWLNEGFASYMEVKSLNVIEPSWVMLDMFLTSTLHVVLQTDAKLSSHPIVQTVDTPDQITAIFDLISYKKGASILRMLEGFIGEENFRKGVSDYLKKYQFGNTITQDLLKSLEPYFKAENPELNITHIMDTWTRQMGYPVLQVTKSDEPNSYIVKQKRFLLDPEAVNPNDSDYNYRWFVPITYKTNKAQNSSILWFPNTVESVKIELSEDDSWVKLNNDQVGYYRVNYDNDMWQKLIHELHGKSEKLTPSDRAHLINDGFELASSGHIPYSLALNLSTYLLVEQDLVPWQSAADQFYSLSDKLMKTTAYNNLQKYVQKIIQPLYGKQSWEMRDLSVSQSLIRSLILSLALRFQLPDAENRVRNMFLTWLQNHSLQNAVPIEADIRDLVYFYGMKLASQTEWDKLWEIYLNESDAQEKNKLRRALSAPRDVNILQGYMTLAWDESKVRSQDYLNVLSAISDNPAGADLVWSDVRNRWPALVDRFTLNSRYLGGLIPAITKCFYTEDKLKEMESFFKQYPEAGAGETARKQALETVKNNIKWAQSYRSSIAEWLLTYQE